MAPRQRMAVLLGRGRQPGQRELHTANLGNGNSGFASSRLGNIGANNFGIGLTGNNRFVRLGDGMYLGTGDPTSQQRPTTTRLVRRAHLTPTPNRDPIQGQSPASASAPARGPQYSA